MVKLSSLAKKIERDLEAPANAMPYNVGCVVSIEISRRDQAGNALPKTMTEYVGTLEWYTFGPHNTTGAPIFGFGLKGNDAAYTVDLRQNDVQIHVR